MPTEPDFQVRWRDAHSSASELVSLDALKQNAIPSKLRNATASLYTDTTYIEVSDLEWSESTHLAFTPHRLGFSATIACSTSIRYGYKPELLDRSSGVGSILLMLPGHEVHAEMTPGRLCTVTCSFDTDYAESIIGPLQQLSPAKIQGALDLRSPLLFNMLSRLMQEAVYQGPMSNMLVVTFGQAILAECAHWLKIDATEQRSDAQITAHHFEIMERTFAQSQGKFPGVAELAEVCGFSERHFAKMFRAQTGMTLSQYIKSVRVANAKFLLGETKLPLKEIAYRLGYSSAANFSTAFTSATGMTPGQYRSCD